MRGGTRRPLRRRLAQSQILTAAADRFRARGYRATTLEQIAGDVGMSKATVYRYFRSKEQLLAAIFHRTMTLFERELASIRTEGLSPDEELRRVVRHHVRTVIAERSFLTVFFEEEAHLPGPLVRSIRRRKAGYDRVLGRIVSRALAQNGGSIDIPPRLLVFALLGMSNWVYTWYRPGGGWTPESVAEAFIALIERGYRGSPAWRRHDLVTRLNRIERDLHALHPLLNTPPSRQHAVPRARATPPARQSRAALLTINTRVNRRVRARALPAQSGSGGRQGGVRRRARDDRRKGGAAPLRGSIPP